MGTCCSNPSSDFPSPSGRPGAAKCSKLSTNFLDQFDCCGAANRGGTLPRMRRPIRRLVRGPPGGGASPTPVRAGHSHLGHLAGPLWRGVQNPSFLQLQSGRAAKPGKHAGHAQPISDDALAYATARMHLEPLRAAGHHQQVAQGNKARDGGGGGGGTKARGGGEERARRRSHRGYPRGYAQLSGPQWNTPWMSRASGRGRAAAVALVGPLAATYGGPARADAPGAIPKR